MVGSLAAVPLLCQHRQPAHFPQHAAHGFWTPTQPRDKRDSTLRLDTQTRPICSTILTAHTLPTTILPTTITKPRTHCTIASWEAIPAHSTAMLAAHHDQENVYTHQAGASKQQLQAKTPGARYPKTPLKVPLNDENANNHGFNGKSVLRGKGNNENMLTVGKGGNAFAKSGKQAMVTPAGESFRAVC